MKPVMCLLCQDVFKLDYKIRECKCGDSWGYYEEDGLHAVYGGADAVPLGIANESLASAIRYRPSEGIGRTFDAFVIPKNCDTMLFDNQTEES